MSFDSKEISVFPYDFTIATQISDTQFAKSTSYVLILVSLGDTLIS
jgi:hypothetical protein